MADLRNLILSIRAQIPDPAEADDPDLDGPAFRTADLLRWVNDAGRLIASRVPAIQDWYGFPSEIGQDVYELPEWITSVEQLWYELLPATRSSVFEGTLISKVQGRAWWFAPHAVGSRPAIHLWPTPSEAGTSTTLAADLSASDTTAILASTAGFRAYGFVRLGSAGAEFNPLPFPEVARYAALSGSQLTGLVRAQGGTMAVDLSAGAPAVECNVFLRCFRLPRPVFSARDPFELPPGLWPVVELYVLAKVREAEQDHATAAQLRNEFYQLVDQLGAKYPLAVGARQGLQVRMAWPVTLSPRVVIIP